MHEHSPDHRALHTETTTRSASSPANDPPEEISRPSGRTARQQMMLFWHLGQILSHLVRDLDPSTLDPIEKRRLDAVLEIIEQEFRATRQGMTAKAAPPQGATS